METEDDVEPVKRRSARGQVPIDRFSPSVAMKQAQSKTEQSSQDDTDETSRTKIEMLSTRRIRRMVDLPRAGRTSSEPESPRSIQVRKAPSMPKRTAWNTAVLTIATSEDTLR